MWLQSLSLALLLLPPALPGLEFAVGAQAGRASQLGEVDSFVTAYTARALPASWRGQSERVAKEILDTSFRDGFDPLFLLAVIENESGFDPSIVGTHGEIGLMQVRPTTAEWVSSRANIRWNGASSLRDPVTNIRIASAYLVMLRAKFAFDRTLYLAAYNMGVTKLKRLLSSKSSARPSRYPRRTIEQYTRIHGLLVGSRQTARG